MNLVTKARTIHLLEQKETIHMISMLRNETCSGSIHDFARISTRNCLADCLTKSSTKADKLITAVQTMKLWKLTFIQTSELSWMTWHSCLHGVEHSCTHGRKKVFFLGELKISLTFSSRRTIPCIVCENFHGFWGSRCYEKDVCTRRLTHLFIHEDDDNVHVHCRSKRFSECLTFLFSQCCGNVDVKTRWSLQNQSFDEKFCWTSWALWKLLLWVSGFFQTQCWSGIKRGSDEARKTHRGTWSLRFQSRYHESRQMFPKDDSQEWRFTLLIFQSHKRHFCWNKLDVRKRAYWRWWWKTHDEDRWYASSIDRTSFLIRGRIRDDQGLNEFCSNSDKMHRATSDDVHTQAWCEYSRSSIFPQSVEKSLKTSSFSTDQFTHAAASSTIWILSIRRVSSGTRELE